MAENRLFFLLTIIILVIALSSCNAYQLFRDSSAYSMRPVKYHILNDPDRYVDRMRQYYDTVAHLKLWRRHIDELNDNDDNTLQDILHQYKSSENYKR